MFKRRIRSASRRKRRALTRTPHFERLENRLLLSGSEVPDFVSRYEFEDNLSDETSTNGATFVGGVAAFQPSRSGLGRGIQLDGQNDYVDLSSVANDVSGDFSVSMWVKAAAGTTDRTLWAINDAQGNEILTVQVSEENWVKVVRGDFDTLVKVPRTIADGTWHHVAFTRAADGRASVYVDGKLGKQYHIGGWSLSPDDQWSLGQVFAGASTSEHFGGMLDDVRIYDRALDAIEQDIVRFNAIKRGEYAYLLGRVPLAAATHTTVASGDWDNPAIWNTGTLPQDGADVVIGAGHVVNYDHVSDARLHTVRVDGRLSFQTNVDTKMIVDTLVVTLEGQLHVGTEASPISAGKTAKILFAPVNPAQPQIDLAWDPLQVSRGLIVRGEAEIWGAAKTGSATLAGDHLAGANQLQLAAVPSDWRVGDTIVVTGTARDPNGSHADNSVFQDEVLTITSIDISANTIQFVHADVPGRTTLRFDHTAPPRTDASGESLKIYVANLTRNIAFETEGWQSGVPIDTRGHTMFMHTREVSIHNAGFYGLGRTDKTLPVNDPVLDANGQLVPGTGTNRRGRYAVHLHRNGADDVADLRAVGIVGNAVWDSPGWGIAIHDSRGVIEENVSFDISGAHIATEDGNEVVEVRRNLAIKSVGAGNTDRPHEREASHDRGFAGHGFWFESSFSAKAVSDNVAVSHASAGFFVWGRLDLTDFLVNVPAGNLRPELVGITGGEPTLKAWKVPLRDFTSNTAYNSLGALELAGHVRDDTGGDFFNAGHSEFGVVEKLTGWSLFGYGVGINYASYITLQDSVLIGDLETPVALGNRAVFDVINGFGLFQMKNSRFVDVVDSRFEGFHYGATVGQTGFQGLGEQDEPKIGPTRIFGGYFANNTENLAAADGRVGNSPSATPVLNAPPFGLWTEIQDSPTFVIPAGNAAPVADFAMSPAGGLTVAFDAAASFDPDYQLEWSEENDNTIASYVWDFDNDGVADRWGRRVAYAFDTPGSHTVALTVYDNQGEATSLIQELEVTPSESQAFAAFVGVDTTQQGSWTGAYGSDGFSISQHAEALPSYAEVTLGASLNFTWVEFSSEARALERVDTGRIAGTWFAPDDSFVIDVQLSDDLPHQVALYSLDWDHQGRLQTIEVLDATTGAVLDTRQASSFAGGVYHVWDVLGHVQFRITRIAGENAGISGIFFDVSQSLPVVSIAASDASASEAGQDPGEFTVSRSGDTSDPLTVQYTVGGTASSGDYTETLGTSVTIPAGQSSISVPVTPGDDPTDEPDETVILTLASGGPYGIGSPSSATVTIADNDDPLPVVTIAASDASASEAGPDPGAFTVSRSGDTSAALVVQYTVGGTASSGDYSEALGGSVTIPAGQPAVTISVTPEDDALAEVIETVVLTLAGDSSYEIGSSSTATVTIADNDSGPAAPVNFVGVDATTQGNWKGVYGADGGRVSQDGVNDPAYAVVGVQQALNFTWTPTTTDVRALERIGSSERLAGTWYSGASFTIDVNLTDGQTHQVALYSLDWDAQGRQQTIEVLDASTGAVLDTRAVSNFAGGVYHVWEVSGHVRFRITKTGGPNAVVSGLFFDPPVAAAASSSSPALLSFQAMAASADSSGNLPLGATSDLLQGETHREPLESSATPVETGPASTGTFRSLPTSELQETAAIDHAMVELAFDVLDSRVIDEIADVLDDAFPMP